MLQEEAQRGKAILVTTHLIAEWNNAADRCLLCRAGEIERELDPANLPDDFDEEKPGSGNDDPGNDLSFRTLDAPPVPNQMV